MSNKSPVSIFVSLAILHAGAAFAGSSGNAAAGADPQALDEVTVTGRKIQATEGSGSYTAPVMSTATKLPLSIRETPQSITVITRERMDDQAMLKSGDALANTPGITATSWSGPGREVYYARGFQIENYTFDGMPTTFESGQMLMSDLALYDRVEVVRGSAGLTQGVGTPSAAINFVRKRPTRNFQARAQGVAASWNLYGIQADVSGPLNGARTLRARMVLDGRDGDSFQDVATERRQLFYLVGEADISADTLLTLSVSRQKNDEIMTWSGLPTTTSGGDLGLPRSTFLGNKADHWDTNNTSTLVRLGHRFGNGWRLDLSANWISAKTDARVSGLGWNWDGSDPASQSFYQTGLGLKNESDRASYDLSAQGTVDLLGRKHELVFGASSRVVDRENNTAGYWWLSPTLATDIDVYNWNHDAVWPGSFDDHHDYTEKNQERQHGFYGTTRLNLADPLKLILGLRLDWYDFESDYQYIYEDEWFPGTQAFSYDRHLTKYAGVIYDVGSQHSVYASYTDIFKPQDARDTDLRFIEPIVGTTYEVGVKGEYFNRALNVSSAIFRIDQENLALPLDLPEQQASCPGYPAQTCYRAAGLVRSKGYELEAQGALSPQWELGGGFTYAVSKTIKDANPANIGVKQNTQLPRKQFKLFTSYQLPGTPWRFGGNLRWQDRVDHVTTWLPDYHTEQGSFAVADAMAGYRHNQHLDVQLNVTNLFDKHYYRIIATGGGNALYGEPRRVMLTAKYNF